MSQRDRILLGVVAALAAIAGYWFLLIAPQREQATALGDQLASAQTRLSAAEAQVSQHLAAKDTYSANYRAVANLGKAVPADDDVRSLVVQIQAAARTAGVDFRTISVEGGRAGGVASTPSAPAPGTPGAPATQAATAALPPGASVGPAGLWTMPFSFSFTGSFFELSSFFAKLERHISVGNDQVSVTGRLLQLDAISLRPDATGWPNIRAQVGATSYLVPPTQGLFAGATPQGPPRATPIAVSNSITASAGGTP
jgi:Tfp pilus assembly protein PilO